MSASDSATAMKGQSKHSLTLANSLAASLLQCLCFNFLLSSSLASLLLPPHHSRISALVTSVYGPAPAPLHAARLSTIFAAYAGRERVLLKLLETKEELRRASEVGVPKAISYMSEASSDDGGESGNDDDDDVLIQVSPRLPRKGITTNSTGDDDTISTISYGTASFAKVAAMNEREKKEGEGGVDGDGGGGVK